MVSRLGRLDLGSAGLAALAGASICMGLIQLLAAPLDQVGTVNVQDVAVQTTLLVAPLLITLVLLLATDRRWSTRGPDWPITTPAGCGCCGGSTHQPWG